MANSRLCVRFLKGVPADVRAECRRVARGFARLSPVRHDVVVLVVPHDAIRCEWDMAGPLSYGLFEHPKRRRSLPAFVTVAARVPRTDYRRRFVRERYDGWISLHLRAVGHTLLHELVHYEQWRDRRPMTERGVNVRARGLYRRIDDGTARKDRGEPK